MTANEDKLKEKIISQTNLETSVRSVYCFGKRHRPDLTGNEDGIAIEIKFLGDSLEGIKLALAQSMFYRLRYKFVINLFILAERHKDTHAKAFNGEERDLENILKDISNDMNIFSYILPAFSPTPT
jgi:hypothetical protein